MCGIFGFSKKFKEKDVIKYFHKLKHRGEDSYGYIAQKKDNSFVADKKLELQESKLFKKDNLLKSWKNVKDYDAVLFHNRWASIGDITVDLAHPIVKENTAVIHNGTKSGLTDCFPNYGNSDTEVIATLLQIIKGVNQFTVELFNGAGVIFGVTPEYLFFHKDSSRPLFINEDRTFISSEPIFKDTWFLVKEHQKIYKNLEDFMETCEVYDTGVVVENLNTPKKCPCCNKKHYLSKDGRCYRCVVKNIPKPVVTSKTYPVGTLVEFLTYENYYSLGEIINVYGEMYEISPVDDYLSKNQWVAARDVELASPYYLIEGEQYYFTDNGTWQLKTFIGESSSDLYPYKTKTKTKTTTPLSWKYCKLPTDYKLNY